MALGCGDAGPKAVGPSPGVSAPPPTSIDGPAVTGSYVVRGITVQALSGQQREIGGTLELEAGEARYEVSFELDTTAPDLPGNVPVRVVGTGRGFLVGDVMTGTTEEWMTLVPPEGGLGEVVLEGVALPAKAGRKLVSTSRASFGEDGSFEIVLENFPAADEDYEPSMTVLTGRRATEGSARR
jgi:hypothetical protein